MQQLYLFKSDPPPGKKLIFRPYFIDPKTGRMVFPKHGKVFPMWVDE
jgi:hypothetical protein